MSDAEPFKPCEGKAHMAVASDHAHKNHNDSNHIDGKTIEEDAIGSSSEESEEDLLSWTDNMLW